jgi:hypothetical protein
MPDVIHVPRKEPFVDPQTGMLTPRAERLLERLVEIATEEGRGLLPALSGDVNDKLRGDGTWAP